MDYSSWMINTSLDLNINPHRLHEELPVSINILGGRSSVKCFPQNNNSFFFSSCVFISEKGGGKQLFVIEFGGEEIFCKTRG